MRDVYDAEIRFDAEHHSFANCDRIVPSPKVSHEDDRWWTDSKSNGMEEKDENQRSADETSAPLCSQRMILKKRSQRVSGMKFTTIRAMFLRFSPSDAGPIFCGPSNDQ